MSLIYAAIGSITTATRIAKELSTRGIRASVVHTPPEINNGGCSYSVSVDEKNRHAVELLASTGRYKIKKLYAANQDGGYNDLS